ncbi:MAG: HAD hydrolase-like protein [Candidatus Muiribacteriota bacterium]
MNLIIDADDTLWENQLFFNQFTQFFKELINELNLDEKETMKTLLKFDSISFKNNLFGNIYYKESMKKTLHKFNKGCEELYFRIEKKHDELFRHPPVLFDNVEETIRNLHKKHHLFLLTKGNYSVQMEKVEKSDIEKFFQGIIISTRKNIDVYKNLIYRYKLDKEKTYMIGNSPKSDIIPALEAGLNAVYIPSETLWELEAHPLPDNNNSLFKLKKFADLKGFFNV